MGVFGDLNKELEIMKLRLKRKKLLLEECNTLSQIQNNSEKRKKLRQKLFKLTNNPIYIHF